jgi:iron complex outermembrane receptor protein
VTDAEVGYQFTEALDLAVGANNLFNVRPDKNGAIAWDGSGQYGGFAPFGLNGGFWYARIGLKF